MQDEPKNIENISASDHPLLMTVYDLPSPQEVVTQDAKRTLKGRLLMIAVLLICAAPVVLSYLTYYVIRPTSLRSFGELIQPTLSLPEMSVEVITKPVADKNMNALHLNSLKGQWLILSLSEGACNDDCQKSLYFQRQIHAALGREKDRVDRVWLIMDEKGVDPELTRGVGDSWVIRATKDDVVKWLGSATQMDKTKSNESQVVDYVYLVDPMGELMMRFSSKIEIDTAPKIRRDLERLLRAAESWDLPGRNDLPKEALKLVPATEDLSNTGVKK